MKQSYLALFLLVILGICSCRKDKNDIGIKDYDDNQIKAYIAANSLTGMQKATDTTGIYYQILTQGTGEALDYDKRITAVLSYRSFDGSYAVTDTILNHQYAFVGNVTPSGLMLAVLKLAKNKGTRARFLIPSRLAYGTSGLGTGSGRLKGNESIDYYINIIDDIAKYDNASIKTYKTLNNLTGFEEITSVNSDPAPATPSIINRKVILAGTGTVPVTAASMVTLQYTGTLLNGTIVEEDNTEAGTPAATLADTFPYEKGLQEALLGLTAGAKVTMLLPSKLTYGLSLQLYSDGVSVRIPSSSCLRFDVNVLTVTN